MNNEGSIFDRRYESSRPRPVPVVIEIVGLATGERPWGAESQFVKSFDPDARDGRGDLVTTPNAWNALSFPDAVAAMEFWRQTSTVKPVRADGKPNRPLTAYTVSIVNFEEKR